MKTDFPTPGRDLNVFVADIFDAGLKDDLASMEHPLFALRPGDKSVRAYQRNGRTVIVKPGADGCATIHDKDLWIYAISQVVEAINRGRTVSRTVRFRAYDFLSTTKRGTSGDSYERMSDALARLSGTRIETNIATGGVLERRGFGLIETWRVIQRGADGRMVAVEVELPDWLFRSVIALEVLTLSREYFEIRKPLHRRIYELARKHCGRQSKWRVSVTVLHEKSGSQDTVRKFRSAMKALSDTNTLPDFRVSFDSTADKMDFYARDKGLSAQLADATRRRRRIPVPKATPAARAQETSDPVAVSDVKFTDRETGRRRAAELAAFTKGLARKSAGIGCAQETPSCS